MGDAVANVHFELRGGAVEDARDRGPGEGEGEEEEQAGREPDEEDARGGGVDGGEAAVVGDEGEAVVLHDCVCVCDVM